MSRAMKRSRLFLLTMAGVGLAGALHLSGALSAQSLATPNFTTAQAIQGRAAYQRSCASCHGINLDDGEFAPPLEGVEFRLRFGGKPLDALHEDVLRMPPTAPNSLGDAERAVERAGKMPEIRNPPDRGAAVFVFELLNRSAGRARPTS